MPPPTRFDECVHQLAINGRRLVLARRGGADVMIEVGQPPPPERLPQFVPRVLAFLIGQGSQLFRQTLFVHPLFTHMRRVPRTM